MKQRRSDFFRLVIFAVSLYILPCRTNADASAAASATVSAASSTISKIDYRYFVAGGTCAAISHGITTPIDVVKTKMQARPDVYNKGIGDATLSILKTDGPSALLSGLGPTVIGYGIEGAMKFGVYEVMKPVMSALLRGNTAVGYIAASVVAGAVASVLLCPMESMRIKMVTDISYQGCNFLTGFPKLLKEDGFLNTFSGVWAMLAKQVPYTMAKQVSFDIIASLIYGFLAVKASSISAEDVKWVVSVSAAFMASIFACIFSQPGDMILTETYKDSDGDKGVFDVVNGIYNSKGLGGFFTGTKARILHVGVIITSQLVVYDLVKQLLGLPATGSH